MVGKIPTSEFVCAIDGAGLSTFGGGFVVGLARAETGLEELGLEQGVVVGDRQHSPVELGAERVALVEMEITEVDVPRQLLLAEAIQLEVVDAYVVAFPHADIELHASLVDDVVEAEIVFSAEDGAVLGGRPGRIESQRRIDRSLEVRAAHVEVIGDGARDVERLGLERLTRLEDYFCLFPARSVFNGLLTIATPDCTARVQQTQQNDEPQTHSRLLKTRPASSPVERGRAMI